jgi:anionic cell wall polymer biosynthesis LytR-Cps2A-Psr (LCP) family protein
VAARALRFRTLDRGFESRVEHGCLFLVSLCRVFLHVGPVTKSSLVQGVLSHIVISDQETTMLRKTVSTEILLQKSSDGFKWSELAQVGS